MNTTSTIAETTSISGMSCGHCVAAVREALQELEGIEVQEVTIGSANIRRDPATVSDQQIAEAIADAGFTLNSINQQSLR